MNHRVDARSMAIAAKDFRDPMAGARENFALNRLERGQIPEPTPKGRLPEVSGHIKGVAGKFRRRHPFVRLVVNAGGKSTDLIEAGGDPAWI